MPWRTTIEVLHVAAGLLATLAIAWVSIWAYPLAGHEIRTVAWVAAAAVAVMGVDPIRRAMAIDRARRA